MLAFGLVATVPRSTVAVIVCPMDPPNCSFNIALGHSSIKGALENRKQNRRHWGPLKNTDFADSTALILLPSVMDVSFFARKLPVKFTLALGFS